MSDPKFKAPIVGHFAAADGNCYPVLLHYLVECDGSEPAFVATDPDVLSMDALVVAIDPATYQGGGEVMAGPCPEIDSTLVYTCTWAVEDNGWDTSWWYGANAAPVNSISPPDPGMDFQQAVVADSFVINGNSFGHINQPDDRVCGHYGTRGRYADSDAPNINPPVDNAFPSQGMQKGWVRFEDTEASGTIILELASSSASSLYAGYTPADMSPIVVNVSGPAAFVQGSDFQRTFLKHEAVYSAGGYWYVYVIALCADQGGGSNHRVHYSTESNASSRFIPQSEISCALPLVSSSVRFEELPYALADDESFQPCQGLVLPEPCCPDPVIEPDPEKVEVFTCAWTMDGTFLWSFYDEGLQAVDTAAVLGPGEANLGNLTLAFGPNLDSLEHVNGLGNSFSCLASNIVSMTSSPDYSAASASVSGSNQMTAEGWIIVPEGQTSYTLGGGTVGQSTIAISAGASPSTIQNVLSPTYSTGGGSANYFGSPILLDSSYIRLEGLGTLVYARFVQGNNSQGGGIYLWHELDDSTRQLIPTSNLSCALPLVAETVRTEEIPYVRLAGESFAPCESLPALAMSVNGIDYETCFADDDGRAILIDTGSGNLFEMDMTPVPAGVACAPQGASSPDVVETWVAKSLSGSATGLITPVFTGTVGVRSFTVSVESGRANILLASGDIVNIRRGSRTWTAEAGDILDGLPSVQGTTANADFDVSWEQL